VYIVRRLFLMLFVLFAISVIVFYLARGTLGPGIALAAYITPRMSDATKLQLGVSLSVATHSCPSWEALISSAPGCVTPLWTQYFTWLANILTGNWGYSLLPGISGGTTTTWDVFWSRFPYTAELAIAASILTITIAIPLGIVSATHNNKLPDHISRLLALVGYSMPIFCLAFILQLVFGVYVAVPNGSNVVGLLPTNGALSTSCGVCFRNPGTVITYTGMPLLDAVLSGNVKYFWDSFVPLILPAIALSFASLGYVTRVLRSSMMEALRQDYILLARSEGLRERIVVYKHAFRNALLPAVTIAGVIVSSLMGGVVIVEYIFSWPGIGSALLSATYVFDVNFLELYILVTASIVVLSNLVVDVLYSLLDPRIRY
jgi:ABC-type dipeptide/oligopeptide/nickel transport system permease component